MPSKKQSTHQSDEQKTKKLEISQKTADGQGKTMEPNEIGNPIPDFFQDSYTAIKFKIGTVRAMNAWSGPMSWFAA